MTAVKKLNKQRKETSEKEKQELEDRKLISSLFLLKQREDLKQALEQFFIDEAPDSNSVNQSVGVSDVGFLSPVSQAMRSTVSKNNDTDNSMGESRRKNFLTQAELEQLLL